MLRAWRDDARELARAMSAGGRPRPRLAGLLLSDWYAILVLWRLRMGARRWHVPLVNRVLRHVQMIAFGIELGKDITLGRGVFFVHPVGITVGGDSKIGDRVRFMGCNTVGTASENGHPVVEDDVTLGAGARILGPVRVGARAVIGANAVVLSDIPADSVAVGLPAKVIGRSDAPPASEVGAA